MAAAALAMPSPVQPQSLATRIADVMMALVRDRFRGETKIMLADIERLGTIVRRGMAALGDTRLASAVTDAFVALARERAVDGALEVSDMERIVALVRRGTTKALEAASDRPGRSVAGARRNPFYRLMVRPLEPLLAGADPVLPRACLPNYFDFLKLVFDADLEVFEGRCVAIVRSLMTAGGGGLTWEAFYADERTEATLMRALGVVVETVHTPEGLGLWYACMIRPLPGASALPFRGLDRIMVTLENAWRSGTGSISAAAG